MNSLTIESRLEKRLRTKVLKFCWICGDEASSKHFGAMSCDACAAFFRRTISGKKTYKCLFKQDCALYNITPRRMCKYCRYQKCRQSGMNPEEVRSGSNTPTSSPPPLVSKPSTSAASYANSTIPCSFYLRAFHRALVLENSVFVAAKNPILLSAYLEPPHDSKLLEIALKNFQTISEQFATFNNSFILQYIEATGVVLEAKMLDKFPKIFELVNQSLQQSAELIKIRVKNDFEFAGLCQLSLIKIASEAFPQLSSLLSQNLEIVTQNFRDYYSNESEDNSNVSLANLSDLATTIHLIRKAYRSQVIEVLKN